MPQPTGAHFCASCGGELGDDGFAARLAEDEVPAAAAAAEPAPAERPTDTSFIDALRRRRSPEQPAESSENPLGGAA